jgi:hypothetical protein
MGGEHTAVAGGPGRRDEPALAPLTIASARFLEKCQDVAFSGRSDLEEGR